QPLRLDPAASGRNIRIRAPHVARAASGDPPALRFGGGPTRALPGVRGVVGSSRESENRRGLLESLRGGLAGGVPDRSGSSAQRGEARGSGRRQCRIDALRGRGDAGGVGWRVGIPAERGGEGRSGAGQYSGAIAAGAWHGGDRERAGAGDAADGADSTDGGRGGRCVVSSGPAPYGSDPDISRVFSHTDWQSYVTQLRTGAICLQPTSV